mgnify:CR=1 FL=1
MANVKHFNLGGTKIDIGEYDDTAIRADLNEEIANRESADTTLQTNINNEAEARESKDTELQQAINTQKSRIDKAYSVTYDSATETITFTPIS